MVGTLLDARLMTVALFAYAGFLRFDEFSNLRLKDVIEHSTYFELFIERSKTDQLREGAVVPIVKTGTDLCPWANLVKYLALDKLVLPTSANGGDGFLFDNIQTGSKSQFIRSGSKLSYTRCREILLKKLADVQLDPKCFFLGTALGAAAHLPQLIVVSLTEYLNTIADDAPRSPKTVILRIH